MERDARLVTGFDWMLSCTTEFEATIDFVREVLGLTIARQGTAQTDTHFSRYACATLPSGDTLEIVEPAQSAGQLYGKQILCLPVPHLLQARAEMERRGAVFVSELFDDGTGLGWIYLQAPGGNIYQIYGPVKGDVA
jgi:catechol 2,3-dioxygenase-like lactoylglutathione lyase family enzyme